MRFDTDVLFYKVSGDRYDPELGRRVGEVTELGSKLCHIYDMSTDERLEVFGRVNVSGISAYHLGESFYNAEYVKVTSGKFQGEFRIIMFRKLRNRTVFLAERWHER